MGSPRSSRRGTGGCSRRRALGWGRRGRAKKSGGPVRRRWVPPTQDPAPVKVRLDDPRRGRHVRVAHHRPDKPVDVGRFERRHLAQGVTVELAELEHVGARDRKGRGRGSLEPTHTVTDERTVRDGRSRRLASGDVGAQGRLSGQWMAARAIRAGLVPRLVRGAGVDPGGHGPGRLGGRRATASDRRLALERRAIGSAPTI